MSNTITFTTVLDSARNLIALVNITGDGSGEETGTVLVDRSGFTPAGTKLAVHKIEGLLSGFTAALSFDASTDLIFAQLPDGDPFAHDWHRGGGVPSSKAGAGATGDILLTTSGLGNGDTGTFRLEMKKG